MNRSNEIAGSHPWPKLPYAEWKDTCTTLHMWSQMVGKVALAFSPPINHWWGIAMHVTSRGLTTGPLASPAGSFEIQFDFISHMLEIRTCGGESENVPLEPRSVADFYREFMGALDSLNIPVKIWTMPVEIANPIRFTEDHGHCSYNREYAFRFWRVLVELDDIFKEFRSRFIGKASPAHFFWGSFDFCATRFSGRRAPERPQADAVTREAYSHEVISAGFWPGSPEMDAAFYAYAAPEPTGFRDAKILPASAVYNTKMGEYLLPYEDVRASASPKAALMEFLESTYDAGATAGKWDRANLER